MASAAPGEMQVGHQEEFLCGKGDRTWEGAARRGVGVPSLEMSKECLEEAFSGLGDKSGICHKLDKVFSN